MKIKRRNFNKLLTSTILASSFSFRSFAENYSGPVNWAGVSFLLPFNEIEKLMPVTKVASEFKKKLMKSLVKKKKKKNITYIYIYIYIIYDIVYIICNI